MNPNAPGASSYDRPENRGSLHSGAAHAATCRRGPVSCREHGISNATFYQWKAKYGGMDASQLKLVKELQEENSRLKRMYAELSMMHDSLKQVVEKKWGA